MNLSRKYLPTTFRTLFNLFMAGVVGFSFLLQVGSVSASPQRDDPRPDDVVSSSDGPGWLDMLNSPDQLYSEYPLETLAGRLILYGAVAIPDCPGGGLLDSGLASKCGVQAAMPKVIEWQNRFNPAIIIASQQTGVPPVLLKNIFAWESQFWPQTVFINTSEYGLGHLTDMGADSVLRWNYTFYQAVCRKNFAPENCEKYYVDQPGGMQSALRGAVLQQVNADCGNCNYGLDLKKAEKSIPAFATTLLANQRLVKIYVQWYTGKKASDVIGDTDLWRFTLSSYNAGPGCFKSALAKTYYANQSINWKNLSSNLDPACRGAKAYVDFVSKTDQYHPDHAPAVVQATPTATVPTPETVTDTPIASATPEVTSTTETIASPTDVPSATETVFPTLAVDTTGTPESIASDTITPLSTFTPTIEPSTTVSTEIVETATETATPEPPTITSTEAPTQAVTLEPPTATAAEIATATFTPEPPTATPTATETITGLPTDVPQGNGASNELVVKFKGFPASLFSGLLLNSVGATVEQTVDPLGAVVVSVPDGQASTVLDQLNNNLLVDYAEPNYVVSAFHTPNDPGFAQQSDALSSMQVPDAWDVTQGTGAVVAVIDTGVDTSHPDLVGALWTNPGETGLDANGNDKRTNGIDDDGNGLVDDWQGWNFAAGNNNPADDNGHGTHLAGIIAARMDNNQGIAGVAPQAKVMALKALDANGHGTYADVAAAIYYAVDHGAKIINLGFGGTDSSQALLDATNYAFDHNVLVVAAGGNTGDDTVFYPAANPNVLAISALDGNLDPAPFSSYNDNISLSAPGVNVSSTLPGGQYGVLSGTSMSSAEVSGVAALLAGLPKFDTVTLIREALIGGALDLGTPGWDANYGYGLVRALDAINYVPGQVSTPTASPTPMGSPTPTDVPGDGGVDIMTDMAASTITTYARSCSTNAASYPGALGGTGVAAIQVNNAVAGPIPLGFEFWYMGTRYTQVYVSSNGWLSFNNPGTGGAASLAANDLDNSGNSAINTAARPILAPLWDNLSGGGAGSVASYTTTGTAPNRLFTFEWWNYQWNNGGASRVSMRVVLHESTGVIDFLYYPNNANAGNSASIGITGTANASFLSASVITNCPPTWSSVTETANLTTKLPQGRTYTFTPTLVTLASPGNVNMTNITATTFTLNWIDNSTGEDGFGIYTSTDGVNYTYFTQAAANATSVNITGNAANYWRVYAAVEGNASPAANVTAPAALNFTGVTQTGMTLNWTDNSNNETGFYIFRSTDNVNFTQVTKTAANVISYTAINLTPSTAYYWRVQAVGSAASESTITAAAAGAQTTLPVAPSMAGSTITTYATSCTTPGFTPLAGGTTIPAIQGDDAFSGPIPLNSNTGSPFEFWYMGTKYTQVYVSSNGWLSFGGPSDSFNANDLDNASGSNSGSARPLLAPLWDNLSGTGGTASYRTQGTAPNRTFTFEWLNWRWGNAAGGAVMSFQVVLYEGTGVIDFNYRQDATAINAGSASIGITGSSNASFLSASNVGACPPTWSSATETANLATKPVNGARYTFNPNSVAPAAPGGLNLTNVTDTSVRLNWTDNSTTEDGFGIYTSTDGTNYTYFGQVPPNTTSYTASSLINSANNYWKVYAAVEGRASAAADVIAPAGLNFTNVSTTSMTLNWTDNSSNETGFYIFRSTDNNNFTQIGKTAANATSYNAAGLTIGTPYYWRVLAVANATAETTLSAAATGSQATSSNTPPVVTITAPANNSTYVQNTPITFIGTAMDAEDGNISANLVWYSDLTGPFGTGGTVNTSSLLPGTHTIMAKSTDSFGASTTASITVTVTPLSGPHGGFNGSTDQCAQCHRAHSAQGSDYLTTDPNSVLVSDSFCLSCHNGTTATAVSTHSNKNWGPAVEPQFEIRCVQCHDPHGNTSNLFAVKTQIETSLSPDTTAGPVAFTAMTGIDSFDDGVNTNTLCTVCHTSISTTSPHHPGGDGHQDPAAPSSYTMDYSGQSCVACHPHNADANAATQDGFMPVRNTNP